MKNTVAAFGAGVSRRKFLSTAGMAGMAVAGASTLAACGGGSSGLPGGGPAASGNGSAGAGASGGTLTWASWANPGEAERFRSYSKDYQSQHGTKITYQVVVGDYAAKQLTQLAGGSAADVFYIQDTGMAKLIESKNVIDLSEFLDSPESPVKVSDFYEGLYQWCKPKSGDGLYGLPVDCNPVTFWFNKDMLAAAGVAQNPAQMREAGTWNMAALDDILTKIKATGKRGLVYEGGWGAVLSWITTFGGTAFDKDGKAVFNEDPKAQEIMAWVWDSLKNGNFTYGGSLPKGQGADALFYAQQLATIQYGRWILPNLKKLKFGYDIAPLPTEDGKSVGKVPVYTAAMGVNAKAKDPDTAKYFLARFVNKDGQRARLSGGGNAVPAVGGLSEVLTEGNLPEHGAVFEEIAKAGYAIPLAIATNAAVASNIATEIDKQIKSGVDAKTFSDKICSFINGG